MFNRPVTFCMIALYCCLSLQLYAAGITDSESAAHSDEAARYQIENVYKGTDFEIVQFKLGVLAHYSYLLVSDGKVLAVDPGRDVQAYLDYASENNLDWAGTFLTHSHADFVAGHRELEFATGRPIFAGHNSGALYPHHAIKENDTIKVGKAIIKIMETPGHTPDSLCGIISPASEPDRQEFIFSGDTLFVGSLGRPDLMGDHYSSAELASMMFDTWNNKLSRLADSAVVLPAHGAGSLCGANLRDEPFTTIGEEKKSNAYLKYTSNRSAFITKFLTGLEPAPQYFAHNARLNQVGPEKVDWNNPLEQKLTSLNGLIKQKEIYIIDLREAEAYSQKHIPGSVNIALRGRLETWTGTVVPFESRVILTGSMSEINEGARRLKRVGYNADYIVFDDYLNSGGPTESAPMISPADLHNLMQQGKAPIIADVRKPDEWIGMKIGEVLNLPLNTLEKTAPQRLDRREQVVTVCNSAFRSSLAVGLLKRAGFKNPISMHGGAEAWVDAGLPVVRIEDYATAATSADTRPQYRNLGLPERILPAQLRQMLKDLPGTFEIIDIRPADQVQDYNPTGARTVNLGDLIENRTWLAGEVPLIIVDRDGTLAMIAAGILSRKTHRQIKVLQGGIEAYWRETETGFIRDRILHDKPAVNPATNSPTNSQPLINNPKPAQPSPRPIRKGAGC